MILYRPVGLQELELIYDGGMKAFPARLPQQPIFYPVLDLEYARQIASDWNVKNGQFAGYVTEFKVEDDYIGQFEKHTVSGSQHQEFWIPGEEMDEFNRHILGHIRVVEAYFGDAFQGFVPEKFGLQGKNAVAQFTLLANSYIYKRMDFFLEIKRNHKAIYLNYPFWQKNDFKNRGLNEKVLQAIREAWLTSFPKTPLVNPLPKDIPLARQTDSQFVEDTIREDTPPERQADPQPLQDPFPENTPPVNKADPRTSATPDRDDTPPVKQPRSQSWLNPVQKDIPSVRKTAPYSFGKRAANEIAPIKQTASHFAQGLELGLEEKYREAIDELSKAVENNPGHIIAHTSLGVAFHRSGEDDRALSCYEAALKIDPKYAEAHYFRANILHSRGNIREAIAEYTIAIGLKPGLIKAHEEDAPRDRLTDYTDSAAGMYQIAKHAFRILELNKLLETNPGQANLFKERATEYFRLGNNDQAVMDYDACLAIRPDDAGALHFRGQAYEQIGQSDRALTDYKQATAADPQLSDVYINRGVAFGNMGNLRQSIDSLTEGIRLGPANPNGYFNRGSTYFQLGDFENAIADFSRVIQLSSRDEDAYYWRGISNELAGRQQDAIADYKQFLALSQNPDARQEIEQKLRQWNVGKQESGDGQRDIPDEGKKSKQLKSEEPGQDLDLHDLIAALGERALNATWYGSDVECLGEKAEVLYAFTDHNLPIGGQELLRIISGIRQTKAGDFQAFDPGADSPWIFLRAWNGSGFYIETNDPKIKKRLKDHFQWIEEVEGASPPYESLFIGI